MRKTTRAAVAVLATALSVGLLAGLAGTSAAYQDVIHARTGTVAADVTAPFQPGLAKNSRMVDTGLGLSTDGKVYVWGYMGSGAIGGPSSPLLGGVRPRSVLDLPAGIKQVSGMQYDVNALAADGTVYGWGEYNSRNGTDAFRAWNTPQRIRIGSAWNGSGPFLTGVTAISSTETAGAAILDNGSIYSWGTRLYGGSATDGAQQVGGLPDPSVAGNRPVYVKGAYQNFFVILDNGDVYAWGGDSSTPGGYTASTIAQKLTALSSWFKSAVAVGQPYIVAVDGGIDMGGALLSDGTYLSWGTAASRIGARVGTPTTPAPVTQLTGIVSMQFGYTGVVMAKSDGSLWGYGASDDYGQLAQTPTKVDDNVRQFASGQRYYIWQRADGTFWGRGHNPQGALGMPTGTITANRQVAWNLSVLVQ